MSEPKTLLFVPLLFVLYHFELATQSYVNLWKVINRNKNLSKSFYHGAKEVVVAKFKA